MTSLFKIDHITFAPTGGAGLVARGLVESQAQLGHDVRLITVNPSGLRGFPFRHPSLVVRAAFDENVVRNPKSPSMISLTRRKASTLNLNRIRDDSIIHLHWIEGVENHRQVKNWLDSGRQVVWSLHDMAPLTGGCHSNLGCLEFERGCSGCPQVRRPFQSAIAKSLEEISSIDFSRTLLHLVTPSKSHEQAVRKSRVFKDCNITYIPNPIASDFFETHSREAARLKLGISEQEFVGIAIASQLDNPLKRIEELLEIFLSVTNKTGVASRFIIVGERGAQLEDRFKNCTWVGPLRQGELADVFAAADLHASGSLSESAGMTVREAGALGVPSLCIKNGGSDEQIIDGETGFLVDDFDHLGEVLETLIRNRELLVEVGEKAKIEANNESTPLSVAKKYLEIYL